MKAGAITIRTSLEQPETRNLVPYLFFEAEGGRAFSIVSETRRPATGCE